MNRHKKEKLTDTTLQDYMGFVVFLEKLNIMVKF